jgi:hypothetical protein
MSKNVRVSWRIVLFSSHPKGNARMQKAIAFPFSDDTIDFGKDNTANGKGFRWYMYL